MQVKQAIIYPDLDRRTLAEDQRGERTSPRLPNGEPLLAPDELKALLHGTTLAAVLAHAAQLTRATTAEKRLARLIELGRRARRGIASADELAELERLEGEQAAT